MNFSYDPFARPWWWSERDERVSHLAAILRAQGSLPPAKPGTFIPPELQTAAPVAAATNSAPPDNTSSTTSFAAFEAALPDESSSGFGSASASGGFLSSPLLRGLRAGFTPDSSGLDFSDFAPTSSQHPASPLFRTTGPTISPGVAQSEMQAAPVAGPPIVQAGLAAAPTIGFSEAMAGGAARGLGALGGPAALGLTAAGAAYWHSRTPEQKQAILTAVQNGVTRLGQAGTDGFVPPTASAFIDPAPSLPPLPGFAPPTIAPWQEQFPSDSGYRPAQEGFAGATPTSRPDLMASGGSRKDRERKEREERCEEQRELDYATCRDVAEQVKLGLREKSHVARCWSSAEVRYSACCAGRYVPELDIDENYGD